MEQLKALSEQSATSPKGINSTSIVKDSAHTDGDTDANANPSPLKLALDASLNAVNYYMQQYLPGRKSD